MYCYLSTWQMLALLHELAKMRKENEKFNDPIADQFEKLCVKEAIRVGTTSKLVLVLFPKYGQIELPENMVNYIIRLTGLNVFDKKVMDEILPDLKVAMKKTVDEYTSIPNKAGSTHNGNSKLVKRR